MIKHWKRILSIHSFLLLLLSGLFLFPLIWMVLTSFETDMEIVNLPPKLFPGSFYVNNYLELFQGTAALRWTFNSVFTASAITFLVLLISCMAGYALAKKRFFGGKFFFYTFVLTIMIPKQVLYLPLFKICNDLEMYDSFTGLILPQLGWPIGIFLMRQFMVTIPTELLEAAKIDGAGEIRIFSRIILPLAKPGIAALAIFSFIRSWNDFMWQLLIISKDIMRTLPVGIASFNDEFSTRYGLISAGAVVATLPMVLIFLSFQKYFTKGITLGGVKG